MVDPSNERTLTNQLKDYATAKAAQQPPRASKSIHASGYWKCSRMQLYGLLGYEPTDRNYVWAWDLAARSGDMIHNHVQGEFVDSGKAVVLPNGKPAIEVTLSADTLPKDVYTEFASYKLGVRIDAVLNGQGNAQVPIEIKTIDAKYLTGSAQKYFPDRLADYEMQLQMVMHWWRNTVTGERCNNGLILVVNRGDISQRLEYVVEYDALLMATELERVATIRDYWLQAKLTAPEPERGPCGFCAWKTACPAPANQKK
jgi:hypothetical protein